MPTIPDDSAATRPHFPVVATHAPTFRPDQLVADRFRILRLLGSGGMGEVYEAVDLELQEHVALKTIKPAIAQDERVIARFKQEAFLARQVTHPNICRIFDLFVHRAPPAEGSAAAPPPGITFVTMQLLSGPTLAERLHGQRLTTEEALPIVTQMAAALDAAHQVGVVHRDLKSNNVMLVPAPEGGPPRAVITDFGLAWRASDDAQGRDTPSTVTGEVLGTPDYMAPEQVEAGPVTPATDVYALGLVMYEMVTGVRPFAAATPLAAAARRLTEAPPSPSLLVPDLDPSWEAAILRCLERQPADRFQRAGEVVAALEHGAAAGTWRLVIGGALLVALAVGLAVVLWREPSPPAGPSPGAALPTIAPRRSIAVLGFKNVTGRADAVWLSTAFAEMLTTELAAGEALRTIPGENVARMKFELALADADMYAADTRGKIGSSLGTDLVVFGSDVTIGESGSGTIRLDARLQDARDGATIALVSDTGAESDVLQMVSRTGQRLRERLNVEALPPAVTATVLASQPANLDGARLYAEGLARLRQFDALAARDRLERAVAADGRFPMAHAALALAWSTLGYDERAKASARKAFELSSGLSREERLSVEGAYRETAREWTTAIDIYQTLFRFFPDNLEYGLRLANAQVASGAAKDALATIAAIRTPGRAADPRIDLAEAAAAETVSDFKRMRAAAEAAGQRGEALGARLLVARARLLEGTAALTLGEPERALTLYDQARATFDEAGDRGALARALNNQASVLTDHGDTARGIQIYGEALEIARAIGQQQLVARLLNNLAIMKRRAGDFAGSLALNREALAIRREIGDRANEAVSLNNIGNVLLDQGDLADAARHYEDAAVIHQAIGDRRGLARARNNAAVALKMQGAMARAYAANEEALAIRREIADPGSEAISLYNIGEVLAIQGDLVNAARRFEEALAIQRKLDIGRGVGFSLYGLGDVALAQGDTALARTRMEESFAVRRKLGEKVTAAESQLGLARVALADRRTADAERLAREAVSIVTGQNTPDIEATARTVLATAIAAAGRSDAAFAEAERARSLMRESPNVVARLAVTIAGSRIKAVARPAQAKEAVARLESAEAEASRLDLALLRFEAALALAEIAARSNHPDGVARLAALEQDARARGFGLIASRAAEARRAAPN